MVSKIIITAIIIAVSIVSISSLFSLQEIKSVNKFQIHEERLENIDWNNDATKILTMQEN